MQAHVKSQHVGAAGHLARHVHRCLDGVAAADEEKRLLQRRCQDLAQAAVQFQPVHIEKGLGRMADRRQAAFDRLDKQWMVVTQRRRHLPGAEVQVALARGVEDPDAFGPLDHRPILQAGHVGAAGRGHHPLIDDVFDGDGIHVCRPQ